MDRVTQYAKDVLAGKYVVGKRVIQACQRHLDDLEKSKLAPFIYRFDVEQSLEIIDFAETLVLVEGMDEPTTVKLFGFQEFILGSLNGWVRKEDGYRRFRVSYVQLGRQNGKSLISGVLATYYGNFYGYQYPQIYLTAPKMDQAKIVFNEIVKFLDGDEDLAETFTVKDYKSIIECLFTNGKIRALGRDTKTIDGFRPFYGSIDEYHAHETNQMFKLLEGGTRNLKESLISIITTAGFELNSPCYKEYEYDCSILDGAFTNDQRFIFISEIDEKDDPFDPAVWIKANPVSCSTSFGIETLMGVAAEAEAKRGDELRDFMTKICNRWVQMGKNKYMNNEHWVKGYTKKSLADFKGHRCYVGLDLSSGGDLTTLAFVIPYYEIEKGIQVKKYFVDTHSFMPSKRLGDHILSDNAPYDIWEKDGLITLTETLGGVKTDYKYIIAHLNEAIEKYDLHVAAIGYDPHNADAFLNDLEETGIDSIMITQSAKYLNDATEDFRLECEAGNVLHPKDNDLQNWSVINATVVRNSFKEIKIDKNSTEQRIDPIDAILDAYKLAMKDEEGFNPENALEDWLDETDWLD